MFEEFAQKQPPGRKLDLTPTSWATASTANDAFAANFAPFSAASPVRNTPPPWQVPEAPRKPPPEHKPSEGWITEAGKVFKSLRGFVSKNEELIVLAVILLLLLDCDDDLEILIALLILFFPHISKRFFR